jgi:hypothetical protein
MWLYVLDLWVEHVFINVEQIVTFYSGTLIQKFVLIILDQISGLKI